MPNPRTWTVAGLLNHFMELDGTPDRRIAFILGAGASFQSGIPMAGQLVDRWLRELSDRENVEGRPLAEWAIEANLGIPGFVYERAVEHYSEVFARRFEDHEEEGHAYLEQLIHGKEPSFGYSVLAQILARTRHCVVITTNFDNLVSDALAIYTDKLPLVCGHEALAGFVRPNPRRPLVLKIHRDLLLAPKNRSHEIAALPGPLADSLRQLLRSFTPIVIGYGGNDGSLMNLLGENLQPGDIPGGLFWCYWNGGAPPGEPVMKVMRRHGGKLIPIAGFDELMLQLNERLGYPRMDQRIEERARERAKNYRKSFEGLWQRIFPPPDPPAESDAAEPASARPSAPVSDASNHQALSTPSPAHELVTLEGDPVRGSGLEVGQERGAPQKRSPPRDGGLFGPVLSSRARATRGTVPVAEPDERSPRTALEQAAQALVDSASGATDWWKLKLEADGMPSSAARSAAYRRALEQFPEQWELLRGLALELSLSGTRSEGRALYERLERDRPDDPQIQIDLAILYVHWGVGRTQAQPRAVRAWRLARVLPSDSAMLASIAFTRGLLARREDLDDTTALRVLRGLLPVIASPILPLMGVLRRVIRNRLKEPHDELYTLLLACLSGDASPQSLQACQVWNDLKPLAPDAAWPDEGPAS